MFRSTGYHQSRIGREGRQGGNGEQEEVVKRLEGEEREEG